MVLSDENIIAFQNLYKEHYGIDLSREEAYEQGMKLLGLVSIVYRPMTSEEFERIQAKEFELFRK